MAMALLLIAGVIGGCLVFVTVLHFQGEGQSIAFKLLRDENAKDEFEKQIATEVRAELLKSLFIIGLLAPSLFGFANLFTHLDSVWVSAFIFVPVPFLYRRAKMKIRTKYGVPETERSGTNLG